MRRCQFWALLLLAIVCIDFAFAAGKPGDKYEDEEEEKLWASKVKKPKKKQQDDDISFDPSGKIDPKQMERLMAKQKSKINALSFCKLVKDDSRTKNDVAKIASRWQMMMNSAHMNPTLHAIDEVTILVYVTDSSDTAQMVEFLLDQPETEYFDSNSVKQYPKNRPKRDEL